MRAAAAGRVIDGGGGNLLSSRHDFQIVNSFARHTPWLHGALTAYAVYGPVLFGLLLLVAWWRARAARDARGVGLTVWAGIAALIALAVNQPIAHAAAEPRPYAVLGHLLVLIPRSADFAFPSDHAVMAGAVATGLLFVDRRLGLFAWVAALVLAFARVYVGAHWPLDVVAGLALGAAVATPGILLGPVWERGIRALAATPLRVLLLAGPGRKLRTP